MQYIEPYNTYIFVAGKNLCGTKIKFAGCREIFWGLGKKKGGGSETKNHFSDALSKVIMNVNPFTFFFENKQNFVHFGW